MAADDFSKLTLQIEADVELAQQQVQAFGEASVEVLNRIKAAREQLQSVEKAADEAKLSWTEQVARQEQAIWEKNYVEKAELAEKYAAQQYELGKAQVRAAEDQAARLYEIDKARTLAYEEDARRKNAAAVEQTNREILARKVAADEEYAIGKAQVLAYEENARRKTEADDTFSLNSIKQIRSLARIATGIFAIGIIISEWENLTKYIQNAALSLGGFDDVLRQTQADAIAASTKAGEMVQRLTQDEVTRISLMHDAKAIRQEETAATITGLEASRKFIQQELSDTEARLRLIEEYKTIGTTADEIGEQNAGKRAVHELRIKDALQAQNFTVDDGVKLEKERSRLQDLIFERQQESFQLQVRMHTEQTAADVRADKAAAKEWQHELAYARAASKHVQTLAQLVHGLNARAEAEEKINEKFATRALLLESESFKSEAKNSGTLGEAKQWLDAQEAVGKYLTAAQKATEADEIAAGKRTHGVYEYIQLKAQEEVAVIKASADEARALVPFGSAMEKLITDAEHQRLAAAMAKEAASIQQTTDKLVAQAEKSIAKLDHFYEHADTPMAANIKRFHEAIQAIKEHDAAIQKEIASLRQQAAASHDVAASIALETEANKAATQAAKDKKEAEAEAAAGAIASIAGVIAGRRAQAGVEMVFDIGMGIRSTAQAILDHDPDAALAAVQYFAAAAEQGKIALSHGAHGGGGGGSVSVGSGAGGGGSGSGSGGGGHMPTQMMTPGGPAGQDFGKAITLNVYGHVFADNLSTLANKLSTGVNNGNLRMNANVAQSTGVPKA